MDSNGSVAQVTGRQTGSGKTIYDIAAVLEGTEAGNINVKLATFDSGLANRAKGLEGARASFRYNVKQNGQYTNYYLEDIARENELPAADSIPITPAGQQGGKGGGSGFKGGGGRSPEERKSIVKMNVFGTAADFVAAFYGPVGPDFYDEAEKKLFSLAERLFNIVKEQPTAVQEPVQPVAPAQPAAAAQAAPIVPTATTPEGVAVQVAGVQVGTEGIAPATTPQEPAATDAVWN